MDRPRHVWNESKHLLADGILYEQRRIAKNRALELSEEELDNLTLLEIEKFLQANRRSLADFPTMPYPKRYVTETLGNRLIYDEKNYNSAEQLLEFNKLYASLTDEQKAIYEKIIDAVNKQQGEAEVQTLTQNMRLQSSSDSSDSREEISEFSEWLLKVEEGKLSEPNDGYADIQIPNELLITDYEEPIKAIVENTYPDLLQNFKRPDYLQSRAILASTIQIVDEVNNYVLDLIPGEAVEYSSADSIDRSEAAHSQAFDVVTTEFLSSLRCSGNMNINNCMAEHRVLQQLHG
ncbi:ATP-dependent DNA helicase PIF1 [Trifolium repens]|nr:ATP-dependent DNA helicase PIF1 [Trifolium repens]